MTASRPVSFCAGLILAASTSAIAVSPRDPTIPDNTLTPGAIASTNLAEICGRDSAGHTYSQRHRVWHDKTGTLSKYGIPLDEKRLFEDDDRVPVCLGGDNTSPLNHWSQPRRGKWNAHLKDRLEAAVCHAVCDGDMRLDEGQAIFFDDWREAYRQLMAPPQEEGK